MLDSLFSQPNYLAAKKLLEATSVERNVIASNLANVETPRYRRLEIAPSFREQLSSALGSGDVHSLGGLSVQVQEDALAVSTRIDGNTVSLEREMFDLMQNSLDHALETQLVTGNLLRLRLAITGRS